MSFCITAGEMHTLRLILWSLLAANFSQEPAMTVGLGQAFGDDLLCRCHRCLTSAFFCSVALFGTAAKLSPCSLTFSPAPCFLCIARWLPSLSSSSPSSLKTSCHLYGLIQPGEFPLSLLPSFRRELQSNWFPCSDSLCGIPTAPPNTRAKAKLRHFPLSFVWWLCAKDPVRKGK